MVSVLLIVIFVKESPSRSNPIYLAQNQHTKIENGASMKMLYKYARNFLLFNRDTWIDLEYEIALL